MYSPQVLHHFEHPRNSGELPDASAVAKVENPVCGDVLEFAIRAEEGKISAARFRARGCVASVACASQLTEMVIGKTMAQARAVATDALLASLGGLPEGSIHASHLAIDALSAALDQLESIR